MQVTERIDRLVDEQAAFATIATAAETAVGGLVAARRSPTAPPAGRTSKATPDEPRTTSPVALKAAWAPFAAALRAHVTFCLETALPLARRVSIENLDEVTASGVVPNTTWALASAFCDVVARTAAGRHQLRRMAAEVRREVGFAPTARGPVLALLDKFEAFSFVCEVEIFPAVLAGSEITFTVADLPNAKQYQTSDDVLRKLRTERPPPAREEPKLERVAPSLADRIKGLFKR